MRRIFRGAGPGVLLLVAGLIAQAGCGSEKKPETKAASPETQGARYEELTFVPDPALLGFVYSDSSLGLRIAPPRGWPPLDPALFAQVQTEFERLAPKDNRYVAQPVRIFCEQERKLFMIVSRFPHWPLVKTPESAIAEYRQLVIASSTESQMLDGYFKSGNVKGYRLLLMNEAMANFRILVFREGQTPVQLNYLVPRSLYPEVQKAIEASVGSIKNL